MRRRWIMKSTSLSKKEFFPGAMIYYTIGESNEKYRAKITEISHCKYKTDMYDDVSELAGKDLSSCMMGVRITGKVLEDLFFRKLYSQRLGIGVYYHTNLMDQVNCVIVSLERNERTSYYLFVPGVNVRHDGLVEFLKTMGVFFQASYDSDKKGEMPNDEQLMLGFKITFDTDYYEKVSYVHSMQKACVKRLKHKLELSWRPLPNILDNPELNQYPEDWNDAWNAVAQSHDIHAHIGLKYALTIGKFDNGLQIIMPVNRYTLEQFFSFPAIMDLPEFEDKVKFEYIEHYEDNYPQVIPRYNDYIDIIGVDDTLTLKYKDHLICPVSHPNVPAYMNVLVLDMECEEDSWGKIHEMILKTIDLPESDIPEHSIFRNTDFISSVKKCQEKLCQKINQQLSDI